MIPTELGGKVEWLQLSQGSDRAGRKSRGVATVVAGEFRPEGEGLAAQSKDLLRPDEAAAILRVSKSTIYRLCNSGDLEAVRVRRSIRIRAQSIASLIERSDDEGAPDSAAPRHRLQG
jgi:excisionase family DNA binding protein